MPTATSIHAGIVTALTGAGLHAPYWPADDLPTAADGLVEQAAVVRPDARLSPTTRLSGGSSGGSDSVVIYCVGPTIRDALAVADKVHAAIDGLTLSDKGGPLAQTARTAADVEPNADPRRVSLAVEYTAITKD